MRSSKQQAAAEILAAKKLGTLDEFIDSRRSHTSWRGIAHELWRVTDGRVDVAPETVRNWAQTPGA